MRKLILAVMLSVLLLGFGIANAVTGVEDAVPGQDVVFPIICEGHADDSGAKDQYAVSFGTMNTIWAIADKSLVTCDQTSDSVCDPHLPSGSLVGVVFTKVFVNDSESIVRLDTGECWSRRDVISNDCQNMVSQMSWDDQKAMEVEIGGVTYFAGYVLYLQQLTCDGNTFTDRFIPWVYLNDALRGFAAGVNGVSLEQGTGAMLEEDTDVAIAALTMYPRYFILNDADDTLNWWIFLLGRNQLKIGQNEFDRVLRCNWCNEAEKCVSKDLHIPLELNIFNISEVLPGGLFAADAWPKAGFAYCNIEETGFLQGFNSSTTLFGTMSFSDDGETPPDPEVYSIFGYSYQRGSTVGPPAQKLAVIHPMHRVYCRQYDETLSLTGDLPNRFSAGNSPDTTGTCCIQGPIPGSDPADSTTWAQCP